MNECTYKCHLCGDDNADDILYAKILKEIKDLKDTTNCKLLYQDGKIAELVVFIKENLSNELRNLIETMEDDGEINAMVSTALDETMTGAVRYEPLETECRSDELIYFSENVSVDVVRNDTYKTSYLVTKIKNFYPYVNFTNGANEKPYEDNKSVVDYMKTTNKLFCINAGLKGVTVKDGVSFIEENTSANEGWYVMGITDKGELKSYNRSTTASQIIADGCRDAINVWTPLIINGEKFNFNNIDKSDENYDYIITSSHPRQALGMLFDGTYVIVTSEGRMVDEKGLTSSELQQIMYDLGCEIAFNLDGGASTQTVCGNRLLNRRLSESRVVGTVITFERGAFNDKRLCK